jgi:hypothetical protein
MTTADGWRHVSRLRGAGGASVARRRYATRSRRSQTGSALITTTVAHKIPVLITAHRSSSRRRLPGLPSSSVRIPAPATDESRQFWTDSIAAAVIVDASAHSELAGPFKLEPAPVDGALALATSCEHPPSRDALRWVPRDATEDELHVACLAGQHELAGGHTTVTSKAAMRERHEQPIGSEHLVTAIAREYVILGKISETEFARWCSHTIGRPRGEAA